MNTLLLLSTLIAAAVLAEPTDRWDGMIEDEKLQAIAPKSDFLTDASTFEKLWMAWRPDEAVPKVDFKKELTLVATVPGPNRVVASPMLEENGDLRYVAAGTRRAGPGFGYLLLRMSNEGVKTINGKPLNQENGSNESIRVTVIGKLQRGIVAIGGETTGTTITSKGITWELDLGQNEALAKLAEESDGRAVEVQGSLERMEGVEIKARWIVHVESLRAVDAN